MSTDSKENSEGQVSYASIPPRYRRILLAMRKSPQGVDMNAVESDNSTVSSPCPDDIFEGISTPESDSSRGLTTPGESPPPTKQHEYTPGPSQSTTDAHDTVQTKNDLTSLVSGRTPSEIAAPAGVVVRLREATVMVAHTPISTGATRSTEAVAKHNKPIIKKLKKVIEALEAPVKEEKRLKDAQKRREARVAQKEKEENERRRLEEEMQQQEATKKLSSIEERQMEEEEAGPAPAIGKRKREPEVTVGTSRKSARIAGRKPRRGAS